MNKSFEIDELRKTPEVRYMYAGFWIRATGWALDTLILTLVLTPIFISLMALTSYNNEISSQAKQVSASLQAVANFSFIFVAYILPLLLQWLYFSLQYSSKYQATLGMRVFGLRIISETGGAVSFSRATGRYFASFLSGVIFFIGRLIMPFMSRKQTLHDIMAGTYIIRKIEIEKK
ncbi:MAG: RDD family protein [Candidatus Paracaedimonas acanthamoebae]|uniref:RDD family protein n=1 Tax=Candidatus Paracaedimonas acanthamoebae TaxID=244581 RepID=A0A8J7PIK4_9PROT|nr:RDD family protein [Candidatus Paracaedimonas acanthamoebae]